MRTLVLLCAVVAFVAPCAHGRAWGYSGGAGRTHAKSPKRATQRKRLRAFGSDRELRRYLRKLARAQGRIGNGMGAAAAEVAVIAPVTKDAAAAPSATPSAGEAARTAGAPAQGNKESVTNVQHAGVDEGGIVKLHGDHLVVLRRGRLFTIDIGGGELRPVSSIDAFGPGVEPDGWYDELLVSDETVVVVGYSYERGGTEVSLFRIDDAGRLSYRATYQLRSDDYYSWDNYASRLIGNKLIFYAPLGLSPDAEDPFETFPAMRRWHEGAEESEFRRIAPATRVYRPGVDLGDAAELALHTVTVCDLAREEMSCEATALVGPPASVFYVSPASVYIWASDWPYDDGRERPARPVLYRMPLDGSAPSALRVKGDPADQFSFLESEDGHLNVLVRADAERERKQGEESAEKDVALLRVPLWSFSDGTDAAPASSYRKLPTVHDDGESFQNRFVGDYLLYGTGGGWYGPGNEENYSNLYAVRWAGGEAVPVPLRHNVDRIEALGSDAIVVGTDDVGLRFTSVRLADGAPRVAGSYVRKEAQQGETRSHGFFYKPEGPDSGLLGLPIMTPFSQGNEHPFGGSAAVLFLRNESLNLKELGQLDAHPDAAADDNCLVSCVDWYGNARPLFLRGRVFALLGYEVVEGALRDGRFVETRRISYAPRPAQAAAR